MNDLPSNESSDHDPLAKPAEEGEAFIEDHDEIVLVNEDKEPLDQKKPVSEPTSDLDSTANMIEKQYEGAVDDESADELFEEYQPRTATVILAQQQAIVESEAAEAAGIILEGIDEPEFDKSTSNRTQTQLLDYDHGPIRVQVQPVTLTQRLCSPGAQFIYALLIIGVLGGLIGLAATVESPTLILIAGIASPILLPICVWKWIRWLDSSPYYYRLLTSLGEDARNLLGHRLFWKRS